MIDDRRTRTDDLHLFHVVAGIDNGCATLLETADTVNQMRPTLRIHADGRLIQNQQNRIMHHSGRKIQTTLHPAGKRFGEVIRSRR